MDRVRQGRGCLNILNNVSIRKLVTPTTKFEWNVSILKYFKIVVITPLVRRSPVRFGNSCFPVISLRIICIVG